MPATNRRPTSFASRPSRDAHRIAPAARTADRRAYIVRLIPGRTRLPLGPEWIGG